MANKCLWCKQTISQELRVSFIMSFKPYVAVLMCEKCRQLFSPIDQATACPGCGRRQKQPRLCEDCQIWQIRHEPQLFNRALFPYATVQEYMSRYKFQGDYELRKLFQKQFQSFILASTSGALIVPIPISEKTIAVRKFNQVEGWLEGLSYQRVLEAESRDGLPQSKKDKRERMQLKQPFSVRNAWEGRLKNRSICLIDDVYTTGTTLHLAADLLYSYGAKNVSSITFAR